ncbi:MULTISPECIES: type VII secretion system-associated protein [Amycolatopsis]|uniref:Type VII secretion system-associated protein n=1 Tax=Amycolatopsis albidoflavus TaxID=102226 RepID=A0ABW5HSF7_9PSEU
MAERADPFDGGGLMVLVDLEWKPTGETPDPPLEVLLGAWVVSPEGERGVFQPNPVYRPRRPDSPLDPIDAILRMLAKGEDVAELLLALLSEVLVGIAVDERGVALVRPAPDGVPSVLVTTSPGHRVRVDGVPGWANVTVRRLAEALPRSGVDVLLNPGGPAAMRLLADTVRDAASRTAAGHPSA